MTMTEPTEPKALKPTEALANMVEFLATLAREATDEPLKVALHAAQDMCQRAIDAHFQSLQVDHDPQHLRDLPPTVGQVALDLSRQLVDLIEQSGNADQCAVRSVGSLLVIIVGGRKAEQMATQMGSVLMPTVVPDESAPVG